MKKALLLTSLLLGYILSGLANGILFQTDSGSTHYLPVLKTEVSVVVNQQVATVTATQHFKNDTGFDSSFVYGFPLPEGASATNLRWNIGPTWYTSGFNGSPQDSSLVFEGGQTDWDLAQYLGANPIWAPIEPGLMADSVMIVSITYVQLLPYSLNRVSFHYPNDYGSLIPYTIPSQTFEFQLYSQRSITDLVMTSHLPDSLSVDSGMAYLALEQIQQTVDTDYELSYGLSPDELGIFSYSTWLGGGLNPCDSLGEGFFALIVEPESGDSLEVINKDFVLVLDRSGSMSGQKIVQAVDASKFIIDNLNLGDRFNIVDFSSTASAFAPQLLDFTPSNRLSAINYLDGLTASGGTNFGDALSLGLPFLGVSDSSRAQIVMFLTDGQGNPSGQNLFNLVSSLRNQYAPNLNFFSIGIGQNTNEVDLTQVANQNNGFPIFLNATSDLNQALSNFYLTIQNPVLLNPQIEFLPAVVEEVFPTDLPNLYAGQQLILLGRYVVPDSVQVDLSGTLNGQNTSYQYDIELTDSLIYDHLFLYKLWAKSKIDQLYQDYFQAQGNDTLQQSIEDEITQIGTCYGIVSPFTSFSGGTGGGGNGGGVSTALEEEEVKETIPFRVFPNPFSDQIRIEWQDPSFVWPEEISISIYDFHGSLVAEEVWRPHEAFNWDGTDLYQEELAAGIYFLQLRWADQSYEIKLIKR